MRLPATATASSTVHCAGSPPLSAVQSRPASHTCAAAIDTASRSTVGKARGRTQRRGACKHSDRAQRRGAVCRLHRGQEPKKRPTSGSRVFFARLLIDFNAIQTHSALDNCSSVSEKCSDVMHTQNYEQRISSADGSIALLCASRSLPLPRSIALRQRDSAGPAAFAARCSAASCCASIASLSHCIPPARSRFER